MTNIQTERLVIRNFVNKDWEQLKEIIIDKEASKYAVYDYQFPTTDNELREITKDFASSNNYLAVCESMSGKIIGFISLNGENERKLDLGFCIYSPYQRRGYAFEACKAVINYAFSVLNVDILTSGTANENYPACKLLHKLGLRICAEGTASFRKTPDGLPIEFLGSLFVLEKKNWLQMEGITNE